MKEAIFVGVMVGVFVSVFTVLVTQVKEGNAQAERTEQTFRAECAAVNGRAVWNNKYWECLK